MGICLYLLVDLFLTLGIWNYLNEFPLEKVYLVMSVYIMYGQTDYQSVYLFEVQKYKKYVLRSTYIILYPIIIIYVILNWIGK